MLIICKPVNQDLRSVHLIVIRNNTFQRKRLVFGVKSFLEMLQYGFLITVRKSRKETMKNLMSVYVATYSFSSNVITIVPCRNVYFSFEWETKRKTRPVYVIMSRTYQAYIVQSSKRCLSCVGLFPTYVITD